MRNLEDVRVAVVGAGITGLRCADILRHHTNVEVFESCERDKASRPLQMAVGAKFIKTVPDLEPTYPIRKITYRSENEECISEGDVGYLYKIGGREGIDAVLRKKMERLVKINYATKIKSLEELEDFSIVIAADGYRSLIPYLAGLREKDPYMWGVGLGCLVEGRFQIGVVEVLYNIDYTPGGYTYTIPISVNLASVISGCITKDLKLDKYRKKLRSYIKEQKYEIIEEWKDFVAWYNFDRYYKNNIYVIGGAASFTDQTYNFGLKYSIESAKACAKSIIEHRNYEKLLKPILKELNFWKKVSPWFLNITKEKQDRFVRRANNPFLKWLVENGKSIRFMYNFTHFI